MSEQERYYELTDETLEWKGRTLRRICWLHNGLYHRVGDYGGWLESERNLAQSGALVKYNAKVYGNARVRDKAVVAGDTEVYGNAVVGGEAETYGYARIYDNAKVVGKATIRHHAVVAGTALVEEYAKVGGTTVVRGSARVAGEAVLGEHIDENGVNGARIEGSAFVGGDATLPAGAIVDGDACVTKTNTCLAMPIFEGYRNLTFIVDESCPEKINVRCWYNRYDIWKDLREFETKVLENISKSSDRSRWLALFSMVRTHFSANNAER